MLTPEQYLALSTLAYETPTDEAISKNIEDVRSKTKNKNRLEFRALSSLSSWVIVNAQTSPSGMSAIAVQNPETGEVVFVYRGTDPIEKYPGAGLKDWLADLDIAHGENFQIGEGKNQFVDALSFYDKTIDKLGGESSVGEISFTGHSLGGGLAQYMAYATGGSHKTITFDAVGIGQNLPDVNPRAYDDVITDYVNENDFIGMYGTQLGKEVYLKDNGSQSAQERNAYMNRVQEVMINNIMESDGLLDIPPGIVWTFGIAGTEALKNIRNGLDDLIFDPHRQSGLLDSEGNLSQEVSGPNSIVAAAASTTKSLSGASYEVFRTAAGVVEFVICDIPYAVGEATAEVSITIIETGAEVVTVVGETTASTIYTVGTFIGYTLYDVGTFFKKGISDIIGSLMNQAGAMAARVDPIVLDVSGLGITTKSVDDGVYYDLDNNGFAEKTGWIDTKSGILVLDKDTNGYIETGNELFGDRTILDDGTTASSGFAALAALDSNHDGVIG